MAKKKAAKQGKQRAKVATKRARKTGAKKSAAKTGPVILFVSSQHDC
jgi:hypothetical protein